MKKHKEEVKNTLKRKLKEQKEEFSKKLKKLKHKERRSREKLNIFLKKYQKDMKVSPGDSKLKDNEFPLYISCDGTLYAKNQKGCGAKIGKPVIWNINRDSLGATISLDALKNLWGGYPWTAPLIPNVNNLSVLVNGQTYVINIPIPSLVGEKSKYLQNVSPYYKSVSISSSIDPTNLAQYIGPEGSVLKTNEVVTTTGANGTIRSNTLAFGSTLPVAPTVTLPDNLVYWDNATTPKTLGIKSSGVYELKYDIDKIQAVLNPGVWRTNNPDSSWDAQTSPPAPAIGVCDVIGKWRFTRNQILNSDTNVTDTTIGNIPSIIEGLPLDGINYLFYEYDLFDIRNSSTTTGSTTGPRNSTTGALIFQNLSSNAPYVNCYYFTSTGMVKYGITKTDASGKRIAYSPSNVVAFYLNDSSNIQIAENFITALPVDGINYLFFYYYLVDIKNFSSTSGFTVGERNPPNGNLIFNYSINGNNVNQIVPYCYYFTSTGMVKYGIMRVDALGKIITYSSNVVAFYSDNTTSSTEIAENLIRALPVDGMNYLFYSNNLVDIKNSSATSGFTRGNRDPDNGNLIFNYRFSNNNTSGTNVNQTMTSCYYFTSTGRIKYGIIKTDANGKIYTNPSTGVVIFYDDTDNPINDNPLYLSW